jgi:hypothetical protein
MRRRHTHTTTTHAQNNTRAHPNKTMTGKWKSKIKIYCPLEIYVCLFLLVEVGSITPDLEEQLLNCTTGREPTIQACASGTSRMCLSAVESLVNSLVSTLPALCIRFSAWRFASSQGYRNETNTAVAMVHQTNIGRILIFPRVIWLCISTFSWTHTTL